MVVVTLPAMYSTMIDNWSVISVSADRREVYDTVPFDPGRHPHTCSVLDA
jgi:hypothetical protein